jgi:hypothetical protein
MPWPASGGFPPDPARLAPAGPAAWPPLRILPAAFADRPFTIVVGTGESDFARERNRILADAFARAYAAHAQTVPPRQDDAADPPADRNLVLIGNPRSNRVLGRLAGRLAALGRPLPLAWDHRSVRGEGIAALRSAARSVVLAVPHPDASDRLLVILDGTPPGFPPGPPLADLPACSISP